MMILDPDIVEKILTTGWNKCTAVKKMQCIIYAGPLVDIFYLSLWTVIFPRDWKLAKVHQS